MEAQAPADAYHVVAGLMPDWYWAAPPPPLGVRLQVTGRDGIVTVWDVTEELAGYLKSRLSRRLRCTAKPYADRSVR